MTSHYLIHTSQQGERWDNLAFYYYGNALEYGRIIDANPQLSLYEVLPIGVTVYIPVLTIKPTNNENMPPWLKGNSNLIAGDNHG